MATKTLTTNDSMVLGEEALKVVVADWLRLNKFSNNVEPVDVAFEIDEDDEEVVAVISGNAKFYLKGVAPA